MNNNRSTISHTIRGPGFKYDVIKGELSKGSSISKLIHPFLEVEEFKASLLARNRLKDMRTHWVLKKNIRTGHLMAVNLHFGYPMKESPYSQDIIVTEEEAIALDGKLQEKQICVSDSQIIMKSVCDTLRYSSVNVVEVNADALINHGADTFGQEETFVFRLLQERGIISPTSRHGISGNKEADIVDEVSKEQYEVVYEFKTALSKKKMKPDVVFSPEMLMLQLVDSPFIHVSKSLEKKFRKEYNVKYRSNLVILTLGTKSSTIAMLEALSEKLKNGQISNDIYSNIYIVSLDFMNEHALLARISATEPFWSESFPCKNEELGLIKITPVEYEMIDETRKYLMVCEGIFDNTQRCRYDTGKELKIWAKQVRIKGI